MVVTPHDSRIPNTPLDSLDSRFHERPVGIIMIEKNPAAILTLRQRMNQAWKERPIIEQTMPFDPNQNSDAMPERVLKLQKVRYMPEFVLIESDMRMAVKEVLKLIPERADLLVSELLGSFGCNELSPECLDPAQLMLKPDVGVSIQSVHE